MGELIKAQEICLEREMLIPVFQYLKSRKTACHMAGSLL